MTSSDGFREDWIRDSTCSFHMCANKKLFDRYKSCDVGHVIMTNGSRSKVIGIGTIKIKKFHDLVYHDENEIQTP